MAKGVQKLAEEKGHKERRSKKRQKGDEICDEKRLQKNKKNQQLSRKRKRLKKRP